MIIAFASYADAACHDAAASFRYFRRCRFRLFRHFASSVFTPAAAAFISSATPLSLSPDAAASRPLDTAHATRYVFADIFHDSAIFAIFFAMPARSLPHFRR